MGDDFESVLGVISGILSDDTAPVDDVLIQAPSVIDVGSIRRKAGLSQAAFAARIGIPVGTLRNWEQGHRSPQGPARVLLALLDRNPRIVEETLQGGNDNHG